MKMKLNPKEIAALRADGYYVAVVAGQGDERYAWESTFGARQVKTQQPARRSEAQAWHDCSQYAVDGDPEPARPDWLESADSPRIGHP